MNDTPKQETQAEQWEKLRDDLHENDIDTYYAVHTDGHHQGWKALTLILENKMINAMDQLRAAQDAAYENDPDSAIEYNAMIKGLKIAQNLLTQSNQ